MEVEFDVKMTSGVLYDYMLHHNYSSFSGIIGNVVGALMLVGALYLGNIIFLVAGLIVLLYVPWSLFLRSKQQMLRTEAFKQPLHYKMTEDGIQVSQGDTVQSQPWDSMHKAVSTGKCIIVYTSPVNASIFPKKDMGEMMPKVIEMISVHMPPAKVKIRG